MASNATPDRTRVRDPYDDNDEMIDDLLLTCGYPARGGRPSTWWLLLCCIIVPIRRYKNRPKKHSPEVEFLERRQKGSDPPEPLLSRRRALTLPGAASGSESTQQQSLFFSKLPMDIRYMIYQYVAYFSGRQGRLHVVNLHKRLRSVSCSNSDVDSTEDEEVSYSVGGTPSYKVVHGWEHSCWKPESLDGTSVSSQWIRNPRKRTVDRIGGLLCSCRRVYSEAIDLLYTVNSFNVRLTRTIVDMQRCILPQRFRMIRSLELNVPLHALWGDARVHQPNPRFYESILTFWGPAWAAIMEMCGLLKLSVSINARDHREQPVIDRETLTHILRPMMAVRHVPQFSLKVRLPLPDESLEDVLQDLGGDPPFSLEVKEFRFLEELKYNINQRRYYEARWEQT